MHARKTAAVTLQTQIFFAGPNLFVGPVLYRVLSVFLRRSQLHLALGLDCGSALCEIFLGSAYPFVGYGGDGQFHRGLGCSPRHCLKKVADVTYMFLDT